MLKTTDKRRAKYLLEVRGQGGHRFLHFVRTNKIRYTVCIGYCGVFAAYLAYINQWFLFWVIIAFVSGSLTADFSWLRGMKKSWPFFSKVTNWDEVKRISEDHDGETRL